VPKSRAGISAQIFLGGEHPGGGIGQAIDLGATIASWAISLVLAGRPALPAAFRKPKGTETGDESGDETVDETDLAAGRNHFGEATKRS
jgi:hypothetical protein